jgi:hypothetical protein
VLECCYYCKKLVDFKLSFRRFSSSSFIVCEKTTLSCVPALDIDKESHQIVTNSILNFLLQHVHHNVEEPSTLIAERCHRARINSAIFVSSEGRGFDSIEFIRRYGSQSVLCRKAKSAENIPTQNRNVSPATNYIFHPKRTINSSYIKFSLNSVASRKIHRTTSSGKAKSEREIHQCVRKLSWLNAMRSHHR